MAEREAVARYRAERDAKLATFAEACGHSRRAVGWVSDAITFISIYKRRDAATWHISAAELCRMLIADLEPRHPAHVRMTLEAMGIASSSDVGAIVYALIDAGCCAASESDSRGDFDGLFERDRIDAYITATGLDRQPRDISATLKLWGILALYALGSALLLSSYRTHDRTWQYVAYALLVTAWIVSKTRFGKKRRFGIPWSSLELRQFDKPAAS